MTLEQFLKEMEDGFDNLHQQDVCNLTGIIRIQAKALDILDSGDVFGSVYTCRTIARNAQKEIEALIEKT